MNVVDSSAWLEYLSDGRNAEYFAPAIENQRELIVPTLCVYEVFKRVCQQRTETEGLQAVALMRQGFVVDLDVSIALSAARWSQQLRLPLADSVILATAREHGAILWTQDSHFEGVDAVRYRPTS